jgi:serpin B
MGVMKRLSAFTASVVLLLAGCAGGSPSAPATTPPATPGSSPIGTPSSAPSPTWSGEVEVVKADVPRLAADPAEATRAADAINAFGLDMYRKLASSSGNLVMSPASVGLALSMAQAGARGATATEMNAVLHGLGSDAYADAVSSIEAALTDRTGTFKDSAGHDNQVSLQIANALFPQRGLSLEQAFLDAMASRFGAGVNVVDYATATEAARTAINAWVASHTENRIPEILRQDDVTSATRLALANAIYLKAAWLTPFPKELTKAGPFTLADGSTVQAPYMHSVTSLAYADGAGWAAVKLPYVGNELAMLVIVPADMATFEAGFDAARLADITSSLSARRVDLTMPKFDIESRFDLGQTLAALGMPTAFGRMADFSGITSEVELHISTVIHVANMTVDEAGTEAAAATVIAIGDTAGPAEPVELRVDHPFIVVIRDTVTGAAVFVVRVEDPSATR